MFRNLAYLNPQFAERRIFYASHSEWPVWASDKYHAARRAGSFAPYTIAMPNFNVGLLGHSYFAQAKALLPDIYDLMRKSVAAAQRQRHTATFEEGYRFGDGIDEKRQED